MTDFLKHFFCGQRGYCLLIIIWVLDLFIILSAALLAFSIVQPPAAIVHIYRDSIYFTVLCGMAIYPACGVYRVLHQYADAWVEIKSLIFAWHILFITLLASAFLTESLSSLSRLWVGILYLSGLLLWISKRMALRFALKKLRRKGYGQRFVAIIGTGKLAEKAARMLHENKETGLLAKGFYHTGEPGQQHSIMPADIIGNIDRLFTDLRTKNIHEVWIALPFSQSGLIKGLINRLDHTSTYIRLVPDFSHAYQSLMQYTLTSRHPLTTVNGLPVLDLCVTPMIETNRLIKYIEDKCLSVIILLLIAPLMFLISFLIKCTSRGPVLYKQERTGWNGKRFYMLKFRSMPVNNEKKQIKWGNAHAKETTCIGQLLRKTSLDELPQFINVLKGEMSIVGPRPERTVFVEQFKHDIPKYMRRHKVKAGITGWAQINGLRGDTDLTQRVEHDLYYIKNWSLWFDLKIIFLSALKGFINKG